MTKLLTQVVILAIVLYASRAFGLGSFGLVVAGVVSIIAVHVVYERLLGPAGAGRAIAIRDDDPLMLEAIRIAKEQWPTFVSLASVEPQNAVVKFRVRTDEGPIENIWGDVLEIRGDGATVRVRTPPIGRVSGLDLQRTEASSADIVDWQVIHEDNTLSGGFTQRAAFRIVERDGGSMPAQFAAEMARYRETPRAPE
jgi:hypothetical protein